ncbi:DUF262 domain-containing protein [Aquiflexum gelatinilyticum]|uniref:DUF262 domain-containing protein n=1 Tax=Aquiflexum gelatinilyticum TaxID=2961943 RepID=UPI002167C132|nr:DUF262 domain-containing HNH endonuclease family protein [Aquiflexum gelatinilyticum]MCS4435338.1 DUF262 domain-containing HNH endonuclease family protein [Aquiflexum gelatinilyticum]
MDKVKSQLINIASVVEEGWEFNIPIYQRLYVWTEEQVKTLFEDLHTAFTAKKDLYYIGGIILVQNALKPNLYDLVDGQQRFTTLWLLSNELRRALLPFTYNGKKLRLQFSIRENVSEFFTSIDQISNKVNEASNDFSDLMQVGKARNLIIQLIDKHLVDEAEKQAFSNFIFEKLKMVKTTVPPSNDLNKLFEALNNRGAQLEHHEILKARLLGFIKNVNKRQVFAKLWQACSVMDNYIERVIALEIGSAQNIAAIYHNGFSIKNVLELFDYRESNKELSLSDVIQKPEKYSTLSDTFKKKLNHHPEATEDEFEPVRSVLSFPQLLLHTLRIFLFDQKKEDIQRINEKELLEIFDKHFLKSDFIDEKSVITFIETLFEVRNSFDRYVIKWVTIGDQKEEHILKDIYKQNQKRRGQTYYLRRLKKEELHGIGLLQSILYHSQQNTTQYWLTPFLYWMIDEKPSFNDAFLYLRHLDNTLLSSNTEKIPLPERTIQSISEYLKYKPAPEAIFGSIDNLNKEGTAFPHYWFYKIEFVLWYYRNKLGKAEAWKDYKMTARNSIEHIGPQNPRSSQDKVCDEMLDTMGNLVLVTRSINSEYSDKAFGVKKSMFLDKKSKGSIDSLKSDLIYEHQNWNDKLAQKHFEKIMQLLNTYFEEHKLN